jgi:hypothetical protein
MSQNIVLLLVGLILGGSALAIIIYFVMRYLRGSITLTLDSTAFSPGDVIKGSFVLLTRKQIQGNKLIVSLIGDKTTKIYKDDKTESRTREIHRSEKLIESAREYPAGYTKEQSFEIPIPGQNGNASNNSALGQVLSAASMLINDRDTFYTWRVEARLDAQGVDLAKNQKITINM